MSNKPVPNPWDEGMNPPEPTSTVSGKITIDASLVMFVDNPATGRKMKVAYDPQTSMPDGSEPRPLSQIKIALTPSDPQRFEVVREYLVSSSEWAKVVLPSIKTLGVQQLPQLNGKWATAELVGTGKKYTDRNGEEKEYTALKFTALYDAEPGSNGTHPTPAASPAAAPSNSGSNNGNEKATALKFLGVYVNNVMRKNSGDIDKARAELTPLIANQALLAKHFTVDSSEVIELMMAWKA